MTLVERISEILAANPAELKARQIAKRFCAGALSFMVSIDPLKTYCAN